jgi:hypothetical protein
MKRALSVLATSVITLALFSGSAQAADPKVGSVCPKAGSSKIIGNTKLTCVKSGKKLAWVVSSVASKPTSSSTASPIPAASASPAPTPSKVAFKAQIPITLPIAQNGTITFANLSSRINDLGQVAYQKTQDLLSNNSAPKTINNDVHVGPNTKIDVNGGLPRIQEILTRAEKLFSGFRQVSNFTILIYNSKDEPWAEEEWTKLATARNYFKGQIQGQRQTIAGNCQETLSPGVFSGKIGNCRGADSGAIQNKDDSILTFGQSDSGTSRDTYISNGGIVGHEYVHAVQAAQWIGNPKVYCTESTNSPDCFRSHYVNNNLPCWLNEGSANSIGPMVASDSLGDYQEYRKNNLPYGQGPTKVTDYSEASLRDFLYNQVLGDEGCISNGAVYRLGYSVGALATEMLTAIGGPESVMAIYALAAEGKKWPTAFESVYGVTWSEASSSIAKALAAEYATFGPPPK